ncbi:EGF-like domain protein (macronuclear) [Tetrahymena thermophila SB210]|uniref:EGF-like domain protein n=1 Tax=Tetrahymena thermophila (strain SB210) TaxID=312017 RepID=I7M3S3_TETTS|nr:EGF-like domain protein [Tetrahymena thermophila SB210]EAS03999.2 EGF-like domain protein [Tetrahymena thermophila SB210]|eukprot:XP_001024244.2 EGF-like domain protein [Tetrahymena thermophila SB210]
MLKLIILILTFLKYFIVRTALTPVNILNTSSDPVIATSIFIETQPYIVYVGADNNIYIYDPIQNLDLNNVLITTTSPTFIQDINSVVQGKYFVAIAVDKIKIVEILIPSLNFGTPSSISYQAGTSCYSMLYNPSLDTLFWAEGKAKIQSVQLSNLATVNTITVTSVSQIVFIGLWKQKSQWFVIDSIHKLHLLDASQNSIATTTLSNQPTSVSYVYGQLTEYIISCYYTPMQCQIFPISPSTATISSAILISQTVYLEFSYGYVLIQIYVDPGLSTYLIEYNILTGQQSKLLLANEDITAGINQFANYNIRTKTIVMNSSSSSVINSSLLSTQCSKKCVGCLQSNFCTACDVTKNRIYGKGYNCSCRQGYFEDNDENCIKCADQNCSVCSSTQTSSCIQCYSGYQLVSSQCSNCPLGYFYDTSNCIRCNFNCSSCSSLSQCITCNPYNPLIVQSPPTCACKDGYYLDSINQICQKCHASCNTCNGPFSNQCLTCSNYPAYSTLDPNTGLCNCSPGYYRTSEGTCSQCSQYCNSCENSSTQCTSCDATQNRILNSNAQCVCISGYAEDSTSTKCLQCTSAKCASCSKANLGKCTSCIIENGIQLVLNGNNCSCPSGYYDNGTSCITCHYTCNSCSGQQQNQCTSCNYSLTLQADNTCKCAAGHYFLNGQCLPCSNTCDTQGCVFDASICIACAANSYMVGTSPGKCYCNNQYYFDGNKCQQCSQQLCQTCTSTQCIQCLPNAQFDINGICQCVSGFYNNSGSCSPCAANCLTCDHTGCLTYKCDPTCKTCTGSNNNNCTDCYQSQNRKLNAATGTCDCVTSTYLVQNYICLLCHPSCFSCTGPQANQCQSCIDSNMNFSNGYCQNCKDGYFKLENVCQICNSGCKRCVNSATFCLQCSNQLLLQSNNTCQCNPDSHIINTDQCQLNSCDPTKFCKTCLSDLKTCLSCDSTQNRYLYGTQCLCLPGYGQDASGNCVLCNYPCFRCSNNDHTVCTQCDHQSFRILQGSTCVCQHGYYDDGTNMVCKQCKNNCLTCSDGISCLTCKSDRDATHNCQCLAENYSDYGFLSQCVKCPFGYFSSPTDTSKCLQCDSKCLECTTTSTNCKSCDPKSLRVIGSNTCNCPPQFPLDDGTQCLPCPYYCPTGCQVQLSDPTKKFINVCTVCDNTFNRTLTPDYLCKCNDGYYDQIGTGACQQCHYSCASCTGPGVSQCLTCPVDRDQNTVVDPNTFICTCKQQYYDDPISKSCKQCNLSCKLCSNLNTCLSCSDPLMILKNGVCTCPNGYYLNPQPGHLNSCLPCHHSCGTCLNNNQVDNCLTCAHYTRIFQFNPAKSDQTGTCNCVANLFESTINPIECVQCHYTCLTCQGGSNTQCMTCDPDMNRELSTAPNPGPGQCNCKPNYQASSGTALCTNCDISCQTCSGPNYNQCLTCDSTRNLQTSGAQQTCPCKNAFYEAYKPKCQACHYSCATCDGPNNYNCLTCPAAGSFRLNGQIPLCPCQNYYYDDGKNQNCVPCNYKCAQCLQGSPNVCTSCLLSDNRVYNPLSQNCDCINGYYDDGATQCIQCDPQCVTCQDTTGSCLTCDSSKNRTLDSSSHKCICQNGYFSLDISNQDVCQKCPSVCPDCDKQTGQCKSCFGNNRVLPNCNCQTGYYDVGDGNCQQCDKSCPKSCQGPLKNQCLDCTSLINGQNLYRNFNQITGMTTGTCDCMDGYSEDTQNPTYSQCIKCSPKCLTCLQQNNSYACLSCRSSQFRYLQNNQCLCLPGYYDDGTNCQVCDARCKTCSSSSTKCTSCSDSNNRQLNTSTKKCDCKLGYYVDPVNISNPTCLKCHYSCQSCNGPNQTDCLTCDINQGRKINGGTCICIDGTYDDNSNQLCVSCDWSCSTCSQTGIDCQTCDSTRTLQNVTDQQGNIHNLCVCNPNYYSVYPNKQCLKCHYSCQYCTGPGQYDCTSCESTAFRVQGTLNSNGITFSCNCMVGYFDAAGQYQCKTCPYDCKTCVRDSVNQECLTCDPASNRQLNYVTGRCDCKPGYFEDVGLSEPVCQPCHASCSQCKASTFQDCTQCSSLNFRTFQNGQCACLAGYYNIDSNTSQCASCHYSCKTCNDITGSSNNACLTCDANSFRQQNGTYCQCITGYMDIPNQKACQQCHFSCASCDSTLPITTNQCLSCNAVNNRVLLGSNCPCKTGFYEIPGNPVCQPCDPSCLTCSGSSPSQCLSCDPTNNRVQIGQTCPCAVGYFSIGTNNAKCVSCHYKCLTCNGPNYNQCTSCDSSMQRVLINNQCQCQSNLFDIIDTKLCSSCHYSCLQCTSNTQYSCTSCPIGSNRTLVNNQCLCNDGYFDKSLTQACQKCDFRCKTCDPTNTSKCLSCSAANNRIQSGNSCNCINGYFEGNQPACIQCDVTCLSCNGAGPSSCTACDANQFRQLMPDNTCRCISGYYFDTGSQKCLPCDSNCLQCYGNAKQCTACDSSQILSPQTNTCVCANRYYSNNSICQPCDPSCLQCTGPLATQCSLCSNTDNRTLVGNQCQCSNGFYNIPGKSQCAPCHYSCLTCNGPNSNNCLSCDLANSQRQQNGNQCGCTTGYFDANTAVCQKCHYSCRSCDQQGPNDCLDCQVNVHRNYVAPLKKCSCIDGFYDDAVSQSCLACDLSCQTCQGAGPSNCLTCNLSQNNRIYNSVTGLCQCIDGTFNIPNQARCGPCHYSCQACSSSTASNACTSCSASNQRTYNSGTNRCDCNDGYYDDTLSPLCAPCNFTCKTCQKGDANSCTSCDSVNYFRQYNQVKQTCDCQNGYYSQLGIQRCQPCHFTCSTCNGSAENNCLSCSLESKRYLTASNTCACQVGFYEVVSPDNPAVRICQPCSPTCFSCSTYSMCQGCRSTDNRVINPVTKTCDCKDGFYQVSSGGTIQPICQPCSSANNLIVSQDKQSCICKPGYYMNTQGICSQCPISCSECSSFSNCTICDAANFRQLQSGACVPMAGYFESGQKAASKCDQVCKTCSVKATNCITCRTEDGFQMQSNTNLCICNPGYTQTQVDDSGMTVCRSPQELAQQSETNGNVMWFYIFLCISAILAMIIIIYIARRTCFKSGPKAQTVHVLNQSNQDIFNIRNESNLNLEDIQNASVQQAAQQNDDFGIIPNKKKEVTINPLNEKIKEDNL